MKNGPVVVEIFKKPLGPLENRFFNFRGPRKKKDFFFFPIFLATADLFEKQRPPFDGPGLWLSNGGLLIRIEQVVAEIFAKIFHV